MTKRDILQSDSMEENFKEIFKLFDEDNDGFITLNEFNKVANTFDEQIDKQLKEFFENKKDKRINIDGMDYFCFFNNLPEDPAFSTEGRPFLNCKLN